MKRKMSYPCLLLTWQLFFLHSLVRSSYQCHKQESFQCTLVFRSFSILKPILMKMSVVVIVASLSLVPNFFLFLYIFRLMCFLRFCLLWEGPKQWSRLGFGVISCLGFNFFFISWFMASERKHKLLFYGFSFIVCN